MIAVADYGVGNLFSLISSFRAIGENVVVSGDANVLRKADKIVLPGVGAFGDASVKLFNSGLAETIVEQTERGKPLLGICLGMQLLFDKSFEHGKHKGLGLVKGEIRPVSEVAPMLKVPHIGWNALKFVGEKNRLFKYVNEGDYVYFVHSFYGAKCDDSVIATVEYGSDLTAAVANKNVFGCQFHPEKSGRVGLNLLKAFCEIGENL